MTVSTPLWQNIVRICIGDNSKHQSIVKDYRVEIEFTAERVTRILGKRLCNKAEVWNIEVFRMKKCEHAKYDIKV